MDNDIKKCKDCPHFHLGYKPMMPYETGVARCDKHNLIVEYADMHKINRLTCWEEKENGDGRD